MNKGENHLKGGTVTIKIFPRFQATDNSFGKDYHERTKNSLIFQTGIPADEGGTGNPVLFQEEADPELYLQRTCAGMVHPS